jgi:hypothetical protein
LPSFRIATTPVFAIPVCGLYPILISSSAILSDVLNSRLLSSAFSWNQCLSSIISAIFSLIRRFTFSSNF